MRAAAALLAAAAVLAACGVKPQDVDPPPGAREGMFPRTYPNPALDPLLAPPPRPGETRVR